MKKLVLSISKIVLSVATVPLWFVGMFVGVGHLPDQATDEIVEVIFRHNIYHGCVHNMLHEKSEEILYGLYKSASFVVQAIVFAQTGKYIKHQKELLSVAAPDEQAIVQTFLNLKNGGAVDFSRASEALLGFAQKWIVQSS